MSFFKRTVSALALGVALAGGAALVTGDFTPAAYAQDPASAEARLKTALEMQGLPAGIISWSSVEESGSTIIARGAYADVTQFNLGFNTLPLGDLEVTGITIDGNYVTHFQGRFTGIQVNLADLMATGQKLGQVPAETNPSAAQAGMMLTMMAGYIQGLGYQTLELTVDWDNTIDLAAGTQVSTGALDVKDAFKLDFGVDMTGVSTAYLDWAKANAVKMYAGDAAIQAEMEAALKDPNSPVAKVGFARYAIGFDDAGLMAKLEPQLAMARAAMLGTNPDGTAKTSLTDDELLTQAKAMESPGGLKADKLLPLMKAVYNFVMSPDKISIVATANPALTLGETQAMSNPMGPAPATPVDWNSRITLEASN